MDGRSGPPTDADQRLSLQFAIDNFIGTNIVQRKVTLDYRIVQGPDGLQVETVEVRGGDNSAT